MTQEEFKNEDELVEELRQRVKGTMRQEVFEDDHIFRRFLRARNHNINAAEAMLKNHIKWRNQNKVDSTDYVAREFLNSEYITVSKMGTDLEGTPITYLQVGNLDTKGLLKSVTFHEIHQYIADHLMSEMRKTRSLNKNSSQLLDKISFIFNFEDFSLSTATHKPTLELFLDVISMYEANFPEILKRAYVINVSYYFFLVWSVIKPFITPQTIRKIVLIGKEGWKEELLNEISPDVLPQFLGGNRTDPDGNPLCKNLIRFGGIIPESYYSYANQTCLAKIPGAKKLSVARSSKEEVTLNVLYPGCLLQWEFVVKSRDISFSVLFLDESGVTNVVIPPQKVNTSEATESGMCVCKKCGQYVIEFDNTYSWLFGKEIYYKVEVVKPQPQIS